MSPYDLFVTFVFIDKIIFVFCAIWYKSLVRKGLSSSSKAKSLLVWKNNLEFIFIISVALLCIFLFNPFRQTLVIDRETRFLLFVFGIIVFITSDWSLYFKKPGWFAELQQSLGNKLN
jgi:uncharacterized membrane protein YgdD (TMEM256/DUF423 family)